MPKFPYATATTVQIEARARALVGRNLIEIDPGAPMVPSSPRTKGVVGRIYEQAFDIPANSIAGPDFAGAAIELKSVPIRLERGAPRAKERISIGMIDFANLPGQEWDTASIRKKADRMLLIFYEWHPLRPIARFETLAVELWRPDDETWSAIRSDWELIRDLVRAGRRDEVSESLTRVLGAATKGPGHGSTSRAWSLKQPFVTWLYSTVHDRRRIDEAGAAEDPAARFEASVLARIEPWTGADLGSLARLVGREGRRGKAAAASIVRALAGASSHGRHGDFDRFGVEVKTVPVDSRGRIVESMSFPAFVHEELIYERWDESDLLGRLNRLLIVPIHREKGADPTDMRLGRPFFWSPPESDLSGIAVEWEDYRARIEAGHARSLPKASDTTFIHIRPKSRNASDRDATPGGFDVIKKCFWLNQSYVRSILEEHHAIDPPPPR